jgi:hypothetical protein
MKYSLKESTQANNHNQTKGHSDFQSRFADASP